jgi:DNA-binding NtrC family response regulator
MKKLLILDDNSSYIRALKNALTDDFEIETALTLKEAKEKTDKTIDIFLVDIRLDEKDQNNEDGLLFLDWIKKEYPQKPVIIMSAYLDNYKKDEIIKRGATDILKKPINLFELKEKMKNL